MYLIRILINGSEPLDGLLMSSVLPLSASQLRMFVLMSESRESWTAEAAPPRMDTFVSDLCSPSSYGRLRNGLAV